MFEEKTHKKRKLCSNEGTLEDRISKLPEDLICCHILSRLRTIDAIRTSALSTKWRNLWKLVPYLALNSRKFSTGNDLVTFINKFLYLHKDSVIPKFQLRVLGCNFTNDEWFSGLYTDDYHRSYVTRWLFDRKSDVTQWIDVLSRHHKIQHLSISFGYTGSRRIHIHQSLYTCETLVHLRLVGLNMVDSKFVSLPCLKSLYLKGVACPNVTFLEKLISSSPVFEDLTLLVVYFKDPKPLRLQSQTLKKIYLDLGFHIRVVAIDAPLLECLKTKFNLHGMNRNFCSGISPKVQVHAKFISYVFSLHPDSISLILDSLTNTSIMVNNLVITRNAFKVLLLVSNT